MNFDFDAIYRKEWRELGFYYEFSPQENCWILIGSRQGLNNFSNLLHKYAGDPSKVQISEHEHYGPDSYLKVITWDRPKIDETGIYGTIEDIKKLEELVKNKLKKNVSNVIIGSDFSRDVGGCIKMIIKETDFDAANGKDCLSKLKIS